MRKVIGAIALAALLVVAGAATFALVRIGLAAAALERTVNASQPALTATLANVESSSRAVAASAAALQASAEQQHEILSRREVQRSIMLAAQSGDDLARGVKKFNHLLDLVNGETMPRVNETIDSSRETIDSTNVAVSTLSARGAAVADNLDGAVAELRARLADPAIARLLAGLAETSEQSAAMLRELQVTDAEVRAAIPELLANFNRLTSESGRLSKESADFIAGLNKPTTKKQKLFRILLQVGAAALPGLVQRYK